MEDQKDPEQGQGSVTVADGQVVSNSKVISTGLGESYGTRATSPPKDGNFVDLNGASSRSDTNYFSSGKMEFFGTGSKLEQLLLADRKTRRDSTGADGSTLGNQQGDVGNPQSQAETSSDKYKNPRKRLLMSSLRNDSTEAEKSVLDSDDKSGKVRKVAKWKTETTTIGDSSNNPEASGSTGTACLKVAPIVLKKYYPSAVESAECEEFLVSLSEDDQEENSSQQASGEVKDISDKDGYNSMTKNDYGHMQAEIEKLLKLESPSSKGWKKPVRQRKFQCSSCSKSYSTEDDLQSHALSHTNDDRKIFQCNECDKRFRWIASLKVHTRRFHPGKWQDGMNPKTVEDTTEQEQSPAKEHITGKKAQSPQSSKSSRSSPRELPTKTSTDTNQSKNAIRKSEKGELTRSLPPRQSKTGRDEKSPVVTKKDSKSNDEGLKKPAPEEASETSRDQNTGRASLRRNIQRPKWLTDSDLVTDYEFPRGTNSIRTVSNASSPSSAVSAPANGSQQQSRSAGLAEPSKEISKAQKGDKTKSLMEPPITSSSKAKKERSKQKKGKDKKKAVTPITKPEVLRSKSKKRKAIPLIPPTSTNVCEDDSESPTKQLSTKILELSLDDATMESPSASPKISRKRTTKESPSKDKEVDDDRKANTRSKRKRPDEGIEVQPDDSIESTQKTFGATDESVVEVPDKVSDDSIQLPHNSEEPKENDNRKNDQCTECGKRFQLAATLRVHFRKFHSGKSQEAMKMSSFEAGPECNDNETNLDTKQDTNNTDENFTSPDITDSKKLMEATVNSTGLAGELTQVVDERDGSEDRQVESCPEERISEPAASEPKTDMAVHDNTTCNNEDIVPVVVNRGHALSSDTFEQSNDVDVNRGELNRSITNTSQAPFAGFKGIGFAEVAMAGNMQIPFVRDPGMEKNKPAEPMEQDKSIEVQLPHVSDEAMPVLKPETHSSATGSVPHSVSERLKSVDEDISSSSNHSTIPPILQAPVLSKETTFSGAVGNLPPSMSTTLDELPVIEDEDSVLGPIRRDRSDSLSMRSCGSGSQSEKIKALEDIKEKESSIISENECLVDSDSNDSLMSEFSELAAQVSEKTDGVKFKEEVLRFLTTKVSASSMWAIRKELKRLKKARNYFKFGKLSPLAAGLMHDIYCQTLR